MIPKARHENLLVQAVGDELVVYDQERNRAHRLNRPAALVWRYCDGQKAVADIAGLLHQELDSMVDEELVWVALDRLETAQLLREPINRPIKQKRLSRRQFVQKVGQVGALSLLLPVVQSLVAPTPAQARSSGGRPGEDRPGTEIDLVETDLVEAAGRP